ncbi:uncharacterized protein Z520_11812 [Fonsecaea multimorphosa CBS 102226]|uniref:Uncharacterized protein n=1 Tax=Fonsecaea multimorphosa CBS 102226 TaxID=1442371 RepID=A0A0D2JH29_9EURO|nr:uncharacterized protein Z520_11812 [Fonsecaea multimorphosa CBS 102226]KIX92492.1 hypothetical protein Z520_11812 [Fonsecaea multimorphosa CBS 102226]OAL19605.1 hypothetical protein AYO22_09767 [Fonsecaea multimorphosa]
MSTISYASYISLPALPHIITEWCALVPLVVHLSSPHDEFQVIGNACLRGKICLDLMPKLGQLKAVGKLLSLGSAVLDQTSSAGVAGSMTVWDVSWGSVFQCANGAARELLTAHAFRGKTDVVDVETTPPESVNNARHSHTKVGGESSIKPSIPKNVAFCRPQVLHLVELRFSKASPGSKGSATSSALERLYTATGHVVVTALGLPLALRGAYGTCALLLLSRINALVNHHLPVHRPAGYLGNNEAYTSACMLVAPHDNASTWHLYRGDRAVIDWLLNKPMLAISTPRRCKWVFWYFQLTHYLQLLAMTYVAAQKGWDGLFLLILMVISRLAGSEVAAMTPWAARSGGAAAIWLRQNNIDVQTSTFRMTGRMQMIGAIDLINSMDQAECSSSSPPLSSSSISSPSSTGRHHDTGINGIDVLTSTSSPALKSMSRRLSANWMDSIVPQCPRRDVWLERLSTTMLAQMRQLSQPIRKPDKDTISSNFREIPKPANTSTLASSVALNSNHMHQPGNPIPETGNALPPTSDGTERSSGGQPSIESPDTSLNLSQEQVPQRNSISRADTPSNDVDKSSGLEPGGSTVSIAVAVPDARVFPYLDSRDIKWVDQNALWAWETARCIIQSCAAASSIKANSSLNPSTAQITAVQT